MKCYFALTEPDKDNTFYTDLFEVTLKSARQNTKLELVALYSGSRDHKCYQLMKDYGVEVIEHEFSHKMALKKTFNEDYMMSHFGKLIPYEKISGTFMRMDIPFIEKREEQVFYADIDVIFNQDIDERHMPKPKYLAAAPEFHQDILHDGYFNAGIMLLNVEGMREKVEQIFDDLSLGIPNKTGVFDQGYLNQYCYADMERLPIEFNWKPYWGYNENAKIIHFHGMKPGGTVSSSGFTLDKKTLYAMYKDSPEFISGLVTYSNLYFRYLNRDGSEWLGAFLNDLVEDIVEASFYDKALTGNYQMSLKLLRRVLKKFFADKLGR